MGEPDRCRERPAPSPLPAPPLSWTQGPAGDTGCPPGGDPRPRAACFPGPPSHCVLGAVGGGAPVVCPMVQARSRSKAVAGEPKGKGRPHPSLFPLRVGRSARALCPAPHPWSRAGGCCCRASSGHCHGWFGIEAAPPRSLPPPPPARES